MITQNTQSTSWRQITWYVTKCSSAGGYVFSLICWSIVTCANYIRIILDCSSCKWWISDKLFGMNNCLLERMSDSSITFLFYLILSLLQNLKLVSGNTAVPAICFNWEKYQILLYFKSNFDKYVADLLHYEILSIKTVCCLLSRSSSPEFILHTALALLDSWQNIIPSIFWSFRSSPEFNEC